MFDVALRVGPLVLVDYIGPGLSGQDWLGDSLVGRRQPKPEEALRSRGPRAGSWSYSWS